VTLYRKAEASRGLAVSFELERFAADSPGLRPPSKQTARHRLCESARTRFGNKLKIMDAVRYRPYRTTGTLDWPAPRRISDQVPKIRATNNLGLLRSAHRFASAGLAVLTVLADAPCVL